MTKEKTPPHVDRRPSAPPFEARAYEYTSVKLSPAEIDFLIEALDRQDGVKNYESVNTMVQARMRRDNLKVRFRGALLRHEYNKQLDIIREDLDKSRTPTGHYILVGSASILIGVALAMFAGF